MEAILSSDSILPDPTSNVRSRKVEDWYEGYPKAPTPGTPSGPRKLQMKDYVQIEQCIGSTQVSAWMPVNSTEDPIEQRDTASDTLIVPRLANHVHCGIYEV